MIRMLARTALAVAVLVLVGSSVAAAAGPPPSSYALTGSTVFPEGIAFDSPSGNFFVSSTGDGSIQRGNLTEPVATPFIAGSGAPFSAVGVKLDDGRLYVAGGPTGEIRVYDQATGTAIRTFTTGAGGFLNDIVVAPNGDLFVTDSARPILWRVPAAELVTGAPVAAEAWLDLTGTPIVYEAGFNLNGIVVTPDGKYLIVAQTNTGELFRTEISTKDVDQLNLGGQIVAGDGLALRGRTLFAVDSGAITKVRLSGDLTSGTVESRTSDPSFAFPTTIAIARGRLLVVNSQFDKMGATPSLPFTVSSIPIP